MARDRGARRATSPDPPADRPATALSVATVMIAVALAGCLGATDGTDLKAPEAASNATNATGTGTRFVWNATDNSTYLAVGFEVTTRTKWEMGSESNATWNDTKAAISRTQIWDAPFEGHTPDAGAFGESRRDSCSSNRSSANQPEDCPRRDWQGGGATTFGGTLDPGRYVFWQAEFGAERAEIGIWLETDKPVTVHWVDQGSTRLTLLTDNDATPGYRRGAVQFNADNQSMFHDPYVGYLTFMGHSTKREPSFKVKSAAGFGAKFTREPTYEICRPGQCTGSFPGFYYEGPETGPVPEKVPFAQWAGSAGTWYARARGGFRDPDGAGMPFWAVLEDPRFVTENGTIAFGG